MVKCSFCYKEVDLPFKCPYCGLTFCSDHRLPEQHNCINMPKQRSWDNYKRERTITMIKMQNLPKPKVVDSISKSSSSKSSRSHRLLILFSLIIILSFFLYFGLVKADYDKDGLTNDQEWKHGTDIHNSDTDNDGLKDGDEVLYGTDPNDFDTDDDNLNDWEEIEEYTTSAINPDTDGDDLIDGNEINMYLTDPLNPDTDGDKLIDGDEVRLYKTDPKSADTDKDGLKDDKEVKIGTSPVDFDTDGDGLGDGEEFELGTLPLDIDSDDDGLEDGYEVDNSHTDPLKADSDGDGLNDREEIQVYNTDPMKEDMDDDGLLDGEEIKTYTTDPFKADSDGDGLDDGEEVKTYKTNPLKTDSDDDGLEDGDEVKYYRTNPVNVDTDGDNLDDNEEIEKYMTDPLLNDSDNDELLDGEEVLSYFTDPLLNDTDMDSLLDGQEIYIYKTDPKLNDTDDDLLSDGYEIQIGTDPLYNWRQSYDEEAFKSALSVYLRSQVSYIVKNVSKYTSDLDKAWEILDWVDKHIEYNNSKAELAEFSYFLQTPFETTLKKGGICGDYALLTAALLLDSNISPIYMLYIEFEYRLQMVEETVIYELSPPPHASVGIAINGSIFILDQNLPMRYVGDYYESWLDYNYFISNVTFYEISLNQDGEPIVTKVWKWDINQLQKTIYNITDEDIQFISELIKQKFLESYPFYVEDLRLKNNAENDFKSLAETGMPAEQYLPSGFKKGWRLYYYITDYHPLIAKKLIEDLPPFTNEEWIDVIMECNKFYIKVGIVENQILMVIEIAK